MHDGNALAVTLTVADLRALVRDEVAAALAAREADEAWLSTADAAKRLGTHPKTVARWVRHASLPAHRLGGTAYRFRAKEIDMWLAARDSRKAG